MLQSKIIPIQADEPQLLASILIYQNDAPIPKISNFSDSISKINNIESKSKIKIENHNNYNDLIEAKELHTSYLQEKEEELYLSRNQNPLTLSNLKDEPNDNSNRINYLSKKNKGLEVINRILRQENQELKKKNPIFNENFQKNDLQKKYEEKCSELELAKIVIDSLKAENENIIKKKEEEKKDNKSFGLFESNSENIKELIEENKKLHNFIGIYKEKFNKIVNFVKVLEEKELSDEDSKLKIVDLEQKVELLLIENRKLHQAFSTNQ